MVKTLTRHGNSWAVVIDKPILELLRIGPETPLELSTDGRSLVLSPAGDDARREKFQSAVEDTLRKYPNMLKRLAQ